MKRVLVCLMILCMLPCMTSCQQVHTHEVVSMPYVEPTCTQPGYQSGAYCATCNEVLAVQQVIPALGHEVQVDDAVFATSFQTGLTEGSHCVTCGEVLVPQQVLDLVPPVDVEYETGTITTEPTVIVTEYAEFQIPENVYIPDNMAENMDRIMSIMEEVSGMSFSGRLSNRDGRVVIEVIKGEDPNNEIEIFGGFGGCSDYGVYITPLDLIHYSDLMRVYGDVLKYNASRWFRSYFSSGGLRTYTEYKTRAYVEENCPEMLILTSGVGYHLANFSVYDYDALYQYPVEHWLEHDFTEAANGNACVGFEFMWYLEDVYGDYTRWLTEYETINPSPYYTAVLPVEQELLAYKQAYGDDVFDGFYPWLKEHEHVFNYWGQRHGMDVTNVEMIRTFPYIADFNGSWNIDVSLSWGGMKYHDLWIDVESGRHYMNVYRGLRTDGMILELECDTNVELYDPQGRLIETRMPEPGGILINMDGIGFVKLVGDGTLVNFWMTDFEHSSVNLIMDSSS